MASDCENTSAGGKEVCEILESTGVGAATLLDAIKSPLAIFVIFLGVAAGVVGLYAAINSRVKRGANGRAR